jgi:peptidoglycan/xylan/chitin deacetylase (PgdA/CDA1 family)
MRFLLTLLCLLTLATPAAAQKRIAFTFDDVPRAAGGFFTPDQRTKRLIAELRKAGVRQAGFFVTPGNLDRPDGAGGEARIGAYVRAGHVIANHSFSHLWLNQTPVAAYIADLDKAAAWLKGRPGFRPWYRYPFLDEGRRDLAKRDALRAALAARGLSNGYVTIDNYDWHIDASATAARKAGKRMDMKALRTLYVETLVDAAEFYERIAVETLGRSPAHVILLHETDLNALYIGDLVRALKRKGWQVVGIDEAYRDPIAAREPEAWFTNAGRIAALAQEKGRDPKDLMHERADEAVLAKLFAERVLGEK